MQLPKDSASNEMMRKRLGWRLRAWRKARKLPLKHVAAELDLSVATVSAWEVGARFPDAENLTALAAYTGIPACLFICDEDDCLHFRAYAAPSGPALE